MYDTAITVLLISAAIGAGLMAGVYFAFSGFVMQSLDRLDADSSVDAMNAINEVIQRSWFMPLFFGTTLLFLIVAFTPLQNWNSTSGLLMLVAGSIYIIGMFLCTVIFNVPLNNRLAKQGITDSDKNSLWSHYYRTWTRWNHVRTVSSLIACALCVFLLANGQ